MSTGKTAQIGPQADLSLLDTNQDDLFCYAATHCICVLRIWGVYSCLSPRAVYTGPVPYLTLVTATSGLSARIAPRSVSVTNHLFFIFSRLGECTPVCHQGCVHGTCTLPDTCQCHFGFVGKNCSTECECNGHSNCKSVVMKNVCLECKNNTQVSMYST